MSMQVTASARGLRIWLKDSGRSQEWLADLLGVSQPTVFRWVTGEFRPDTHYRLAIHHLSQGVVKFDEWMQEDERKLAYVYRRKRDRDKALASPPSRVQP